MKTQVVAGVMHDPESPLLVTTIQADALIVSVFAEAPLPIPTQAVSDALNGQIAQLIESGDFSAKVGETAVLYTQGAIPTPRVIVVGLGKAEALTLDQVRRASAKAIQHAKELKVTTVVTMLHAAEGDELIASIEALTEALVEGAQMGVYYYHGQKSSEAPKPFPETLLIAVDHDDESAALQGQAHGEALAAGVYLTRDLANLPPNYCTPIILAEAALAMAAQVGLKATALDKAQLEALKMDAHLAVSRGSIYPPRFIVLEHNADKAGEVDTLVLVGKGVTFDTGGYSIKTTEGMPSMKYDMSGGAAVIGAMKALALMNVPLHVVGLVPAAHNMIDADAYLPSDVITASNGVTIEIRSTDAEGRMLLADALVYAGKFYQPAAVVDIATLTGACAVALGDVAAGLFVNDPHLRDQLIAAGDYMFERVWELPIFPEYQKKLESHTADTLNSGERMGGASTAAGFLMHFIKDYPRWAHIDMAGVMSPIKENPYHSKGASGYGTRLLTQFVRAWQSPAE